MTPLTPSTCQICGRSIKAPKGRIALHGYRRPGTGWQTKSCMGARYRPYEVACDALPPAILSCTAHLGHIRGSLDAWTTAPPETIPYLPWQMGRTEFLLARPEGFDAAAAAAGYCPEATYTYQFRLGELTLRNDMRDTQSSLVYLQDRLDRWAGAKGSAPN